MEERKKGPHHALSLPPPSLPLCSDFSLFNLLPVVKLILAGKSREGDVVGLRESGEGEGSREANFI